MDTSIKYKSFDINSDDSAFKYPNVTLAFPEDVESVSVAVRSKDGTLQNIKLILDADGKGWHTEKMEKERERTEDKYKSSSDRELAEDYFNGCFEDEPGLFDEGLIKNMSVRYQVSIAYIKSIITSYRFEFSQRKKEERNEDLAR